MKEDENRGDTFAELKKRMAKYAERWGKIGKQQPQSIGKGTPAVKPAAPPVGARNAKCSKPATIPSTKEAADRVRAGKPFGNMTIASTTPPEDKPAPKGSQHVRMTRPRVMYFDGVSYLHKNA